MNCLYSTVENIIVVYVCKYYMITICAELSKQHRSTLHELLTLIYTRLTCFATHSKITSFIVDITTFCTSITQSYNQNTKNFSVKLIIN